MKNKNKNEVSDDQLGPLRVSASHGRQGPGVAWALGQSITSSTERKWQEKLLQLQPSQVATRWRVMAGAAATLQHFPISHCNFSHDYVALTLAYVTSNAMQCNEKLQIV